MVISDIDILNFKNIASAHLEFSPGVNCLLGMNGMGKSNLLDSIHFLCMARPMASVPDQLLTRHGEELMMVKGNFESDTGNSESISCGITKGKGKSLKRNGKEYKKISEHIGRFPIVTSTPADTRLIGGPAEERRKLMDMVISQSNPSYLSTLMRYNKSLDNRNRMLKAGLKDALLFESVEKVMEEAAAFIHSERKNWVERTSFLTEKSYSKIAGKEENIAIRYKSQLADKSLRELFEERRQKDSILGFTSAGIHRDDIETEIEGFSLKSTGSQGQLKTFTISLRFAIFDYLRERKGLTPILLLDDIFDKLDSSRVANILQEVSSSGNFGQIFITDTNRKHLDAIMEGISGSKVMFEVENGNFKPLELN